MQSPKLAQSRTRINTHQATHHYGGDGETIGGLEHSDAIEVQPLLSRPWERIAICLFSVLTEGLVEFEA